MSKNTLRGYMILGIVLVAFCCISFLPPFKMNVTFWSAFIFGIITVVFQVYVFRLSFSAGKDAKSRFYGFPIVRIGIIYLIVQLVLSIVEMCIAGILPGFVALLINVLLLSAAAIGCIVADVARDEVTRQDTKKKIDVTNMRSMQSLSASLPALCSDENLKRRIQKMSDGFRYSDPVSSEETREIEYELGIKLQELKQAITDGNTVFAESLCEKITNMLDDRNRVCKLNK